jgi:hypothetical protein
VDFLLNKREKKAQILLQKNDGHLVFGSVGNIVHLYFGLGEVFTFVFAKFAASFD